MNLRNVVGQEDIALVVVLVGIIGVVVIMGPSGNSYEPSEFCQNVASETEANYTSAVDDISCHCESGKGYEGSMNTPEEVAKVTEVKDVLVCDVQYGDRDEQLVYPLLRINETKYNAYNGTGNLSREEIENRSRIIG